MKINGPIVVGVDRSALASDAVRWAARAAAMRHCALHLVSAYSSPADYSSFSVLPTAYYLQREVEGKQLLADAADIATAAARDIGPVQIETEFLTGPAIPHLLALSEDARMMVVGSRGLGEIKGALLGSVSTALATHAQCPVAVIRGLPGAETSPLVGPVVVGIDGTKNSEPAIALAFEEASLRRADLIAVHAWSALNLYSTFPLDDKDLGSDWKASETAERALLAESLAGWQEKFPEVSVHRVVERGQTVAVLQKQSLKAQLVVVGSHGRGGFMGMLLGSSSRSLLHVVERPLLVVREQH
jgi:nucleotide-binding universal stress UspA family protein